VPERRRARAGLPNTRAAYGSVSAVQRDGTLAPVSETLMPPAAAPGGAPAPPGVLGATPGLQVAASAAPAGEGGGGSPNLGVIGGAVGAALALVLVGAAAAFCIQHCQE